jgi:hypothetical protein
MQMIELSIAHEFASHPLSDTCVALEHSVIPKFAMPRGASAEVLTVLQLDHLSLGLSEKRGTDTPPSEAIVDSIMDSVAQRLVGAK